MMELGRHVLIDDETAALVRFAGAETKRCCICAFTSRNTARRCWRDGRRRPCGSAASARSIPRGVQQILPRVTQRAVGVAIPPHFFRDCAATTVALRAPGEAAIIMSILGHATLRTPERHYNHAASISAARQLQDTVHRLRREEPVTCHRRREPGSRA
jgi:hypothetical protein